MSDRPSAAWDVLSYYFRKSQPVSTGQLIELIRRRDWEGARHRAFTHPWDAQYRTCSESNSTPLHLVCLYRAPCDVVQAVLDAHPEAIMATDREGWTPLHVAFLYGANEQTSLLLIRRGGATVASMQSRLVGSPLHVACRHGVSTRVLRELIKTNPSMVRIANESGTKPATLLWNEYAKNPANENVLNSSGTIDTKDPGVAKFVERIRLLLNAATGQDTDSSQPILLHELVAFQFDLDLSQVVPLAVRWYPDQISTRDNHGNLPLHIAASTPAQRKRQHMRFIALDTVKVLVASYPAAASISNREGRLPLHLALACGRRTWSSGIGTLVDAAPQVLMTRDVKTHLYPVHLAAIHEADDDLESLNTIYELLLAWPPALR
jgi:ankyrin repeat protein